MPPLESNPEIILAGTQEELDGRFEAFQRGEVAYLAASDSKRPFHVFIPRYMDCQIGVASLSFEGITKPGDILSADYFPDHAIYARMTDDVHPELESNMKIVKDEQGNPLAGSRKTRIPGLFQKILRNS